MKKSKIIIGILILAGIFIYTKKNYIMNSLHSGHNMESSNKDSHNSMNDHGSTHKDPINNNINKFSRKLLIPPLLEGTVKNGVREFQLTSMEGEWDFISGTKTKTYGYSSPILSPTLLLNKNEETKITITNNLKEATTVHWHGATVGEKVDGVHNSEIMPGTSKEIAFKLNQPASTLWFHPHTHSKTATQVYKGMAGFIYLQDEVSGKLELPKTYGVDDIPLVVQEKKLDSNNQIITESNQMEKTHGKIGGYMTVNGVISPTVEVPKGIIRLRLLNGSNATKYNYSFEGKIFHQIASDGGLLEKPVSMTTLTLAPGERAEILLDTSKISRKFYMIVNDNKALEIEPKGIALIKDIPTSLIKIEPITKDMLESVASVRKFSLSTKGDKNLINDSLYNFKKVDFSVKKGAYEIWEISNSTGGMNMPHPFHVHGTQFRIIERNGKTPPENESGWKDTVNLNPGDIVKILIKFENDGISIYHCHILEHEDGGMMGQFEVK